jgi:hypothetical protein
MSPADARELLGVREDSDEAELRAAYLEKIRQYPPDREPEQFERVRDAWNCLKDPAVMAAAVVAVPPLDSLLKVFETDEKPRRQYVSMALWTAALKEKRT